MLATTIVTAFSTLSLLPTVAASIDTCSDVKSLYQNQGCCHPDSSALALDSSYVAFSDNLADISLLPNRNALLTDTVQMSAKTNGFHHGGSVLATAPDGKEYLYNVRLNTGEIDTGSADFYSGSSTDAILIKMDAITLEVVKSVPVSTYSHSECAFNGGALFSDNNFLFHSSSVNDACFHIYRLDLSDLSLISDYHVPPPDPQSTWLHISSFAAHADYYGPGENLFVINYGNQGQYGTDGWKTVTPNTDNYDSCAAVVAWKQVNENDTITKQWHHRTCHEVPETVASSMFGNDRDYMAYWYYMNESFTINTEHFVTEHTHELCHIGNASGTTMSEILNDESAFSITACAEFTLIDGQTITDSSILSSVAGTVVTYNPTQAALYGICPTGCDTSSVLTITGDMLIGAGQRILGKLKVGQSLSPELRKQITPYGNGIYHPAVIAKDLGVVLVVTAQAGRLDADAYDIVVNKHGIMPIGEANILQLGAMNTYGRLPEEGRTEAAWNKVVAARDAFQKAYIDSRDVYDQLSDYSKSVDTQSILVFSATTGELLKKHVASVLDAYNQFQYRGSFQKMQEGYVGLNQDWTKPNRVPGTNKVSVYNKGGVVAEIELVPPYNAVFSNPTWLYQWAKFQDDAVFVKGTDTLLAMKLTTETVLKSYNDKKNGIATGSTAFTFVNSSLVKPAPPTFEGTLATAHGNTLFEPGIMAFSVAKIESSGITMQCYVPVENSPPIGFPFYWLSDGYYENPYGARRLGSEHVLVAGLKHLYIFDLDCHHVATIKDVETQDIIVNSPSSFYSIWGVDVFQGGYPGVGWDNRGTNISHTTLISY